MTTRSQCQSWRPTYMTAPPEACHRVAGNVWGHSCSGTTILPALNCYPWSASAPSINERLFWSPAIACPQGWVASTVRTTPYRAGYTNGDAEWIAGETAITCCPKGFEDWNTVGNCRWSGTVFLTNTPCTSGGSATETGKVSEQSTSSIYTQPYAKELRLRYQQSDLTQLLRAEPTGDPNTNTPHGSESLSSGAIAAISTLGSLLIIGLVAGFFLIRRRKRRPNVVTEMNRDVNTSPQYPYDDGISQPMITQQLETRLDASELAAPR
jgi:hypothetical protein